MLPINEGMENAIKKMCTDLTALPINSNRNYTINIGNISLPNINDLSAAQDLIQELSTISSDAIQRANKR
jgi:hypothetical protein